MRNAPVPVSKYLSGEEGHCGECTIHTRADTYEDLTLALKKLYCRCQKPAKREDTVMWL